MGPVYHLFPQKATLLTNPNFRYILSFVRKAIFRRPCAPRLRGGSHRTDPPRMGNVAIGRVRHEIPKKKFCNLCSGRERKGNRTLMNEDPHSCQKILALLANRTAVTTIGEVIQLMQD